jgi:hypothetical protein
MAERFGSASFPILNLAGNPMILSAGMMALSLGWL